MLSTHIRVMCTESGDVTRNALISLYTPQRAELNQNASFQCLL